LLPLLDDQEDKAIKLAEAALSQFAVQYHSNWISGMRAKLGIHNEEAEDESLIESLLRMMHKYEADYTNTFLALTFDKKEDLAMFDTTEFTQWYELWQARLGRQQEPIVSSFQLMRDSNPALIPRNHRVEEALEAAEKDGDNS